MTVWYNEIDPYAAQWLRNLIEAGHIADGVVDERNIIDVEPADLRGFTQCHFFAGLGGWSHALRLAGWPDARPVWTGSPPCQPFSVAGRQQGKDDARHLAPHWLELVSACRPVAIAGEQVAAAIRHGWSDDLQDHLEAEGYAYGQIVLPACSVGAPHIRQRLWFVAERLANALPAGRAARWSESGNEQAAWSGGADRLAHTNDRGPQGRRRVPECADQQPAGSGSMAGRLADAKLSGPARLGEYSRASSDEPEVLSPITRGIATDNNGAAGPANGFWRTADWLGCRDGKWRPVEPGTFPLAYGVSARVGRLRAYGNAIVPQVAAEVIRAWPSL